MIKRHILLVDDEVDFAQTMAMRLQLRGYEVTITYNGEDALNKAKKKPDLILLDVMMPVMNGYEICRRIRQDAETKNIPIIMLTAKDMSKDKVEGLQIGADDYITKSSDLEELFARIEALLRRGDLFEEVSEVKAILIDELSRIVKEESVEVLFQPIFYLLPSKLIAYEVLIRGPEHSPLENPVKLFQSALDYGMFFDLEMMYRRKALKKIGDVVNKKFFIFNVSPYIIESEKFKEIMALYTNPKQIILEITERSEIRDFQTYCQTLNMIKSLGFKISVDDVGSGYSSLGSIAQIDPDYAKIEMSLVQGIDASPKKQSLVKAIVSFCQQNKIVVIAEGIESEKELKTILELGVETGQGYLLGRPLPELL